MKKITKTLVTTLYIAKPAFTSGFLALLGLLGLKFSFQTRK